MTQLTIRLSQEQLARLKDRARLAGMSAQDLAQTSLVAWLERGEEDFLEVAQHVVEENADIYRRLA
jgi:hypothetical protein